jgi:hypothetical protein
MSYFPVATVAIGRWSNKVVLCRFGDDFSANRLFGDGRFGET